MARPRQPRPRSIKPGQRVAGILGTIFGGPGLGQVAQAPFALTFLKYSREYETEADLLGARIMANAGYDPRDLANMFRTIEAQGGGGGGFFSDHPSPANRYARINQEAQYLRVNNPPGTIASFSPSKNGCAVIRARKPWPRFSRVAGVIQIRGTIIPTATELTILPRRGAG